MRDIYKLIFANVFAVFFLAGCGKAPEIKFLGTGGQDSEWFVNQESFRKANNKVYIQYAISYSEKSIAAAEKYDSNPGVGAEFLDAFDCENRTHEHIESKVFYKDGTANKLDRKGVKIVQPNAPVEMVFNYACTPRWSRWLSEFFN